MKGTDQFKNHKLIALSFQRLLNFLLIDWMINFIIKMFTFWGFSLFMTVLTYGLFFDSRMLCIWLCYFIGYLGLGYMQGSSSANINRTKFRIGTWNPPTDPNCYVKLEINLKKVF
jgi:hypothetical protein